EEVAASEVRRDLFVQRVSRADRDLDVLGRALAHMQIKFATRVRDDVLIHLVARDADRSRHDDPAERDDRDLGRAAADVDDERSGWFPDGETGADRGG